MKPITLNQNSLVWRLASVYGPLSNRMVTLGMVDSCQLISAAAKGILIAIIATTLACCYAAGLCDLLMWCIVVYQRGWSSVDMDPAALLTTMLTAAIGGVAVMVLVVHLCVKKLEDVRTNTRVPGPILSTFRAWKDKYCLTVTFNDGEDGEDGEV